ncbi:calcium/sodium antiporter [Gordonia sp. CPCC 205515]|uniref:calcium/sodium antiporter n=1 Tax=Gordonia sp. CPCC 205515 TaxID=3140791 RepID=UPI003AF3F831
MVEYVLLVAGLAVLVLGAEWVVRGGSAIAARLGVSPLLVGLTVVSLGTSLPELAIGIDSALNDAGPLAVGNVAGTNIVNILLILGLSAAMVPLALRPQTIRIDLPVMVGSALLLWVLAANGTLSRLDGLILLVVAIVYTATVIRLEISGTPDPVMESEAVEEVPQIGSMWVRSLQLVAGLAVIIVGADWLVDGAVTVAGDLGVSEAVIGLTVVAIGTSAPELVTTIVSTIRGNRDLAIGNLIGSSTYNIAFILGATALVRPLEVTSELVRIDLPLMAAATLLCVPVFVTGRKVTRVEGGLFVALYVAYLVWVVVART